MIFLTRRGGKKKEKRMYLFQRVEIVSHLGRTLIRSWLLPANSNFEAQVHVALRNKYQDDTTALVGFLKDYYNAIILAMDADDPRLTLLEASNPILYWTSRPILRIGKPDPSITPAELLQIGIDNGVMTEDVLTKFIYRSDSESVSYKLEPIELDKE